MAKQNTEGVVSMNNNTTKYCKRYSHLNIEDREEISIGLQQGESLIVIAKRLGRHRSTLSRELKRNLPLFNTVCYRANRAQLKSDNRKQISHQRDRLRNTGLQEYIEIKLKEGWTPEIIAGRLIIEGSGLVTNYESIYQWIYADRRDLIFYLARSHRKRKKRGSAVNKRAIRIPNRVSIANRPFEITNRLEPGHWEADTAVSRQSKAALAIVIERTSRLCRLTLLEAKTAENMNQAMIQSLTHIPLNLRKTITYDNGTENARHEMTNLALKTQSFFCNPYHSWEKGSVENCIGLVRRVFPKKTDWALLTQNDLVILEKKLNARPKKCLGFKTPEEVFVALAY